MGTPVPTLPKKLLKYLPPAKYLSYLNQSKYPSTQVTETRQSAQVVPETSSSNPITQNQPKYEIITALLCYNFNLSNHVPVPLEAHGSAHEELEEFVQPLKSLCNL